MKRIKGRTLRVQCKSRLVNSELSHRRWAGITDSVRKELREVEPSCEHPRWKIRKEVRQLRCSLMKGMRMEVPSIRAINHEYKSSKRGIWVS